MTFLCLSRTKKMKLYKILMKMTVTYASEKWTMIMNWKFGRRILRRKFKVVVGGGVWWVRINQEFDELINAEDIVKLISFWDVKNF